MPISHLFPLRRISQDEFGEIAYTVMEHVFAIHNEFGRFFDEQIYKRELAARMTGVALEVPVTVSFDGFSRIYYLDALVSEGGLFEFKAAEAIHPHHRGQTINYLLLADLEHAKLVNVRPEMVEHEFVNCSQRLVELRHPRVTDEKWNSAVPGAAKFRDLLTALIHDWGAGLELALYEEALTWLLGGESVVNVAVPVSGSSGETPHAENRLQAHGLARRRQRLHHPRPTAAGAHSPHRDSLGQHHLQPCHIHNHSLTTVRQKHGG